MAVQLSPYELNLIAKKLPPQFAALKEKYPVAIVNAADDWDRKPCPEGYAPKMIEVYYKDEADIPSLFIENGELTFLDPEDNLADTTLIMMSIDDHWAYIQVEGRVILNRIGGAILPDVVVRPEVLLMSMMSAISPE